MTGCQCCPLRRRLFCGGCSWVETSTNQEFFWHGLTGCVLVLVRQCRVSFGGVVVSGKLPGRGLCGLCLAHCWVLRQQDLFAAMHLGHFWCFFCSCLRYHRSLSAALFLCGLWCPGVWLMGLLFENYIVDASIWNTHVCVFLQQFLMNEPGPCGHGSLE